MQEESTQEKAIKQYIKDAGTSLIIIQKEDHYPIGEKGKHYMQHSIHTDLMKWHCKESTLRLIWTHSGRWFRAPTSNVPSIEKQEDATSYKTFWIEKYVKKRGKFHEALSYAERDCKLIIWYKLDDIKKTFPNWTIHDV